jgi:hypothetical protein
MRIACVLLVVGLVTVAARPSPAQTTRPTEELAKENAELKKRVEKLEVYVGELEAKLRSAKPAPPQVFKVPPFPRIPAPYGYELPAPPFKQPTPPRNVPAPGNPAGADPAPPAPRGWERHQFNGIDFYVVPLR